MRPPSPKHPRFLVGKKLKHPASPYDPVCFSLYVAPNDCAQSSICNKLCFLAIRETLSSSQACPNRFTDSIALVFFEINFSIFFGFILNVWGLMSANIGVAPTSDIASEVAKYENGVVITWSFLPDNNQPYTSCADRTQKEQQRILDAQNSAQTS